MALARFGDAPEERLLHAHDRLADDCLEAEVLVEAELARLFGSEEVEQVVDDPGLRDLPEAVEVPEAAARLTDHAQLVVDRGDQSAAQSLPLLVDFDPLLEDLVLLGLVCERPAVLKGTSDDEPPWPGTR